MAARGPLDEENSEDTVFSLDLSPQVWYLRKRFSYSNPHSISIHVRGGPMKLLRSGLLVALLLVGVAFGI
jgi:hypothetical protein